MSQAASFQRELDVILACPELGRVTQVFCAAMTDVERGSLGLAEAEDVAVKHGLADVLGTCGLGVVRNPVRFLLLACRGEAEKSWSSRALANLYFALTGGSELARTRIGQVRSFLESVEVKASVQEAPVERAPPPPYVHRPYHPVTRADLTRAAEYVRGQH